MSSIAIAGTLPGAEAHSRTSSQTLSLEADVRLREIPIIENARREAHMQHVYEQACPGLWSKGVNLFTRLTWHASLMSLLILAFPTVPPAVRAILSGTIMLGGAMVSVAYGHNGLAWLFVTPIICWMLVWYGQDMLYRQECTDFWLAHRWESFRTTAEKMISPTTSRHVSTWRRAFRMPKSTSLPTDLTRSRSSNATTVQQSRQ